jgi:SAM-dependent methyltransferase
MNRRERRAGRRHDARANDDPIALAVAHQAQGRPREAVKLLKPVLDREPDNAAAHDCIAMAYQMLGRRDDAVRHFHRAIALGLFGLHDATTLVTQSPAMMAALGRFIRAYPRQLPLAELLGAGNAVADEARLLALLQSEIVRDVETELFLTAVRHALLVERAGDQPAALAETVFDFACALAQQCFLNEYVFGLGDADRSLVARLNDRVVAAGATSAPADLAVLGCYLPLYGLPNAAALAGRSWPKPLDTLLTRQVREPLAEAADVAAILSLTAIENDTSRIVQQQYEESPYPRWTVALPTRSTTLAAYLRGRFGVADASGGDILIAGCGTGEQSVNTAQTFPQSTVLAVDISRTSLAYARRKTRELGIGNIAYAQADILKLGALDRRFDFIESVGVLHHMSDPEAGWRVLRSLLRPGGVIRIALYSEIARQPLGTARALIAERGYRPKADDIRVWRQELIKRGDLVSHSSDFYSTSGCRDLCFNVVEHRFTLPRIKQFLDANRLTLLELETSAETQQQFLQAHPGAAPTDLDRWHAFEQAHPRTFHAMYYLWVRDSAAVAGHG